MAVELVREVEERIEQLGYELVELEQVGSKERPILRIRIDLPESEPGSGVTVDDCARVSRALEEHLDQREGLAATYTLEVSSPGVERPLTRPRHFARFAGQEVAVEGKALLAGRARRLEGVLLGIEEEGERVLLRLPDGAEVAIPRAEISRAHLVYRWGGKGRK